MREDGRKEGDKTEEEVRLKHRNFVYDYTAASYLALIHQKSTKNGRPWDRTIVAHRVRRTNLHDLRTTTFAPSNYLRFARQFMEHQLAQATAKVDCVDQGRSRSNMEWVRKQAYEG